MKDFIYENKELRERFLEEFRYHHGHYKHKVSYKTQSGDIVEFWEDCIPKEILDFIEIEKEESYREGMEKALSNLKERGKEMRDWKKEYDALKKEYEIVLERNLMYQKKYFDKVNEEIKFKEELISELTYFIRGFKNE